VFGLPALWIDRELRDEAGFRGLTVVECGTIITTHLTELVKDNIADLLSYTETQKLLTEVHKDAEKLVADIVPGKVSISSVQRILQNLLSRRHLDPRHPDDPRRDRRSRAADRQPDPDDRACPRPPRPPDQRVAGPRRGDPGGDAVVRMGPGVRGEHPGPGRRPPAGDGALRAPEVHRSTVRETYDRLAQDGEIPCLLTSPAIRPFVRSIIERVRPATVVLSQNEIHARARIRALGTIG
jgi:flagellar biosynthesis protein FlhA